LFSLVPAAGVDPRLADCKSICNHIHKYTKRSTMKLSGRVAAVVCCWVLPVVTGELSQSVPGNHPRLRRSSRAGRQLSTLLPLASGSYLALRQIASLRGASNLTGLLQPRVIEAIPKYRVVADQG
jgi:hypothetical protein